MKFMQLYIFLKFFCLIWVGSSINIIALRTAKRTEFCSSRCTFSMIVKWVNDGYFKVMMVKCLLMMVKCSLMMVKCSSMMVKWVYNHTLISPSLTSISPSLTSILPSIVWSKPSFGHMTIIEKLQQLYRSSVLVIDNFMYLCIVNVVFSWSYKGARQ